MCKTPSTLSCRVVIYRRFYNGEKVLHTYRCRRNPDLGKLSIFTLFCVWLLVHMSISLGENGWQCHHPFWGVSNLNTKKKLSSLGGDVIESRHCWSRHSWAQTSRNLGAKWKQARCEWQNYLRFPLVAAHSPAATERWLQFQGESSLYCLELHASEIKLSEWAGRTSKTSMFFALKAKNSPFSGAAVRHRRTVKTGDGFLRRVISNRHSSIAMMNNKG